MDVTVTPAVLQPLCFSCCSIPAPGQKQGQVGSQQLRDVGIPESQNYPAWKSPPRSSILTLSPVQCQIQAFPGNLQGWEFHHLPLPDHSIYQQPLHFPWNNLNSSQKLLNHPNFWSLNTKYLCFKNPHPAFWEVFFSSEVP